MTRWEPNTPERMIQAAFELYREQGYDETTVAEIAARAGVTERTFFRHFADKREVLFAGGQHFVATIADAVEAHAGSDCVLEAVAAGVEAVGSVFPPLERVRARQQLIAANPELQERELIKLGMVAGAITSALERHGVEHEAAQLAGETGGLLLRDAMARWLGDPDQRPWEEQVRASVAGLRVLAAA